MFGIADSVFCADSIWAVYVGYDMRIFMDDRYIIDTLYKSATGG